jgi:predicted dehydrogenase/threonine dehydrogenase-like Zn-dependent dehydrogenase
MRQLFLDKGAVVLKKVCEPLLDDFSVLVSVHYSCMSSGTEIAAQEQTNSHFLNSVPYKVKKIIDSITDTGIEGCMALIKGTLKGEVQSFGHACSGVVIAVGAKVVKIRAGDFVACAGSEFAKHADIVCVPEHLVAKVSSEKFLKAASITTIGSIALQGIRRAQPQLGETVCVLGLGLLGQLTIQLAKLAGCTVIAIGLFAERFKIAQVSGADYVYLAGDQHTVQEIKLITKMHGVDVTFITAASEDDLIIPLAIDVTRKNGKIVLVSDVGVGFNREKLCKKEIEFLISNSYGPGRYDSHYESEGHDYPLAYVRWTENRNMQTFVQLLEQKKINIEHLVSEEVNLDQAAAAYERVKDRRSMAAILSYTPLKNKAYEFQGAHLSLQDEDLKEVRFVPARRDILRVGFVGAHGFAKNKLMPLVAKVEKVQINAIVDSDVTTALNVSKIYKGARALVADDELFTEDLVDVVIVSSPQKFHCDQALKALKRGKAVFMEKPMVTDYAQFSKLSEYLKSNGQAPFCVNYNRSFAPYIQKIKKVIENRQTPMMVNYRINASELKKNHLIQTDIGAGNIIGEACYAIDIFCYLTNSKPVSVSVEAMHASTNGVFPTDNFVSAITFEDGSVCSLLYTSLGHVQHGVERMEIFYDAKSIFMQDYAQLHGFGFPSTFNETTMIPNKGHENLINSFFNELRKPVFESPISIERLEIVARLSLMIDQLACEGGGSEEMK